MYHHLGHSTTVPKSVSDRVCSECQQSESRGRNQSEVLEGVVDRRRLHLQRLIDLSITQVTAMLTQIRIARMPATLIDDALFVHGTNAQWSFPLVPQS